MSLVKDMLNVQTTLKVEPKSYSSGKAKGGKARGTSTFPGNEAVSCQAVFPSLTSA